MILKGTRHGQSVFSNMWGKGKIITWDDDEMCCTDFEDGKRLIDRHNLILEYP